MNTSRTQPKMLNKKPYMVLFVAFSLIAFALLWPYLKTPSRAIEMQSLQRLFIETVYEERKQTQNELKFIVSEYENASPSLSTLDSAKLSTFLNLVTAKISGSENTILFLDSDQNLIASNQNTFLAENLTKKIQLSHKKSYSTTELLILNKNRLYATAVFILGPSQGGDMIAILKPIDSVLQKLANLLALHLRYESNPAAYQKPTQYSFYMNDILFHLEAIHTSSTQIERWPLVLGLIGLMLLMLVAKRLKKIILRKKFSKQETENKIETLPNIEPTQTIDILTATLNRKSLTEEAQKTLEKEPHGQFVFIAIDLSHFKDINDTLGYETGNQVLICVANKLLNIPYHHPILVGRTGGDEFSLFTSIRDANDIGLLTKKIRKLMESPIKTHNMELEIRPHIGISKYREDDHRIEPLLQKARVAKDYAKKQQMASYHYKKTLDKASHMRLTLINQLRQAIDKEQLKLFFQPKISLKTGRVVGAETLVRWVHPKHGIISPNDFIPIAEETGHIRNITNWALSAALKQINAWANTKYEIPLSVNVSAIDLIDAGFVHDLEEKIAENLSPAHLVTLEITESSFLLHEKNIINRIHTIKELGFSIAIDDFGKGYSSLSQIRTLPVDELKIDKMFISQLSHDKKDREMLKAMVSLANALNIACTGEGVADKKGVHFLKEIGCDYIQSHYITKPLDRKSFELWLNRWYEKERDEKL